MPPDDEQKAVKALIDFAGCDKTRAAELVTAWKKVFAIEALSVVAGTERVTTTVTDLRVERLRRLVDELGGSAALPNPYELGMLLRITVPQARTALRNWQARYPDQYEHHMQRLTAAGKPTVGGGERDATWVIEFEDPEVLDYAVDRLRRRGVQKGLTSDSSALQVTVPKDATATDGRGVLETLGIEHS